MFERYCASTYLTPHCAIDRPMIILGYNARRRVHGLRATLEQEKSRKVRMIEAIQESGLLQGVEYSDAQIKNIIIIQNWIRDFLKKRLFGRDFLKKMRARVKFKRWANRLHIVQAGIFHVQQEQHKRLVWCPCSRACCQCPRISATSPACSAVAPDWSRSIPSSIINIIRNLELARITSQPVLSALSGNLEWNRINIHNFLFSC